MRIKFLDLLNMATKLFLLTVIYVSSKIINAEENNTTKKELPLGIIHKRRHNFWG